MINIFSGIALTAFARLQFKARLNVRRTAIALITFTALSLLVTPLQAKPTELFFSEYVEGSSFNKALEIYNGTGADIDLAAESYAMQIYFNGGASAGTTIQLTGTLADGDVYIVAGHRADAAILAAADLTATTPFFNGNDAVVLRKSGAIIDVIGQVGFDPGRQWGHGNTSTRDNTIRRLPKVCAGDADLTDAFDPAVEWQGFAVDTFDELGSHLVRCNGGSSTSTSTSTNIVINEVDADTPGRDAMEFIELYDGGVGNTLLDGFVIVLFNGHDDASYAAFDLDGYVTDANGYFVMGTTSASDLAVPAGSSGWLQNGADAVALYMGDAANFPNDTPVTKTNLVDAIVYHSKHAEDGGLLALLNAGQSQVDQAGKGNSANHSSQRCPNGSGGAQNTDTYDQFAPSPNAENICTAGSARVAKIHQVQGSGLSVTNPGSLVTVTGVVVGDYQRSNELNGFFLQEEDSDADADANTSEGIFVFCGNCAVDVAEGHIVAATGRQEESFKMSQLDVTGADSNVNIRDSGNSLGRITPVQIDLPAADATHAEGTFEPYEGMLVQFPDELTATEYFQLGRFGQVVLSQGGKQRQFTGHDLPSVAGFAAHQAEVAKRRIILDDINNIQNIDPVYHPQPSGFSVNNFFRGGYTLRNLTGVLHWSFAGYRGTNAWRVRPSQTSPVAFKADNPRTDAPQDTGGRLTVASFNVLNYFTTIDNGQRNCGPRNIRCRGADSQRELDRQTEKIVAAIRQIDADIIGLIELENNASASLQALVEKLHGYQFVHTGTIGTDAIKVGIIYRPATVSPVGNYKILDSSVNARFIDTKNRPSLIQTFAENATKARLTIAVNHLKSKGSPCTDIGDPDTNDGQVNCNQTRTAAAHALVDYLASDPTGSGDPDFLIVGDLNAYAMEDPLTAIKAANYIDLIDSFVGADAYSFVYDGQWGYLDHALASPSLAAQVTGVTEWHINADEVHLLDYNDTTLDSGEQYYEAKPSTSALFAPGPYRNSDHDPVIVGLRLDDGNR